MSPTDVAGVRLGTAADEAEVQLREVLGVPVVQDLPGCNGESGRSLTWQALTASLGDGADGGPVELSGWLVTEGTGAGDVLLPYDTTVGDSAAGVLASLPGATGEIAAEGPYAESFLITTEEAVGLLWLSPTRDGNVVEASFGAQTCD